MLQYDFQQGVRQRLEKMLADCDNIIADARFLVEQWPDLALEVASWRTCRAGTGVASLFILLGLCLRDSPAEKRFCSCFRLHMRLRQGRPCALRCLCSDQSLVTPSVRCSDRTPARDRETGPTPTCGKQQWTNIAPRGSACR